MFFRAPNLVSKIAKNSKECFRPALSQSQSRGNLVEVPSLPRPKLTTFCQSDSSSSSGGRSAEIGRLPPPLLDSATAVVHTRTSNSGPSNGKPPGQLPPPSRGLETAATGSSSSRNQQPTTSLRLCSEPGGGVRSHKTADIGARAHFAVEAVAARLDAVDRFLGPEEV